MASGRSQPREDAANASSTREQKQRPSHPVPAGRAAGWWPGGPRASRRTTDDRSRVVRSASASASPSTPDTIASSPYLPPRMHRHSSVLSIISIPRLSVVPVLYACVAPPCNRRSGWEYDSALPNLGLRNADSVYKHMIFGISFNYLSNKKSSRSM